MNQAPRIPTRGESPGIVFNQAKRVAEPDLPPKDTEGLGVKLARLVVGVPLVGAVASFLIYLIVELWRAILG